MKNKIFLILVLVVIIFVVTGIVAKDNWFIQKKASKNIAEIFLSDKPFKTDEELITLFQKRQPIFESLIKAFSEDTRMSWVNFPSTGLIDDMNWPRAKNKLGITEERWAEYKKNLLELDMKAGISRRMDKEGIFLTCCGSGIAGNGAEKGYVFSETEMNPLSASLDGGNENKKGGFTFRKLEGNWYLYYLSR